MHEDGVYWTANYPRVFEGLKESGSRATVVVPAGRYADWRGRVRDIEKVFPDINPEYFRNETGELLFFSWDIAAAMN